MKFELKKGRTLSFFLSNLYQNQGIIALWVRPSCNRALVGPLWLLHDDVLKYKGCLRQGQTDVMVEIVK